MTTALPDLRLPIDKSVPMSVIESIALLIAEKFDPDKIILLGLMRMETLNPGAM